MQRQWLSASLAALRLSYRHQPYLMSRSLSSQPQWIPTNSNTNVPAYEVFAKDIQKSERDDREYKVIRLQNGLQAMLVHDAKADKAAASLDVAVGHLYDPVSDFAYVYPACLI